MTLTDSYSPVYAGLEEEQMAKVGEAASSFFRARAEADQAQMKGLVKQAMEDMVDDAEAVDRFFGTLHYAETHGSPAEKVAVAELLPLVAESVKEIDAEYTLRKTADWRQNAGLAIGAGGLALSAAPYIGHMQRRRSREGKIKQSLREIMKDHPELRSDPNTSRYFQAIVDFAPDVAGNSLVAGNVMKAMHQIGPSSVTPKMISELLQVQRSNEDRPTAAQHAGEFGKQVGVFGKSVAGKK